jgi:acetyl-CoA carboxylase biotin carboxyl carrier protein
LAALFLRAFFLRDFFAMGSLYSGAAARHGRVGSIPSLGGVAKRERAPRDWIPFAHRAMQTTERTVMAEEIRAEMVANVWKVVKAVGDEVVEGDTLVILESMKMEIPVVVEADGTVSQIAVNEGDVVQEGDLIAVVE